MKLLFLFFLLIIAAVHPAAGINIVPDSLDTYIQQRMEVEKIPGLSIAIIEPNGDINFKNFGYADLNEEKPTDKHTIYEIGSITKTFTAGLIHILLKNTDFTVETPVNKILGNRATLGSYEQTQITLWHLLNHHGALPRLPGNIQPENPVDPYQGYTETMMYDFLNNYQPEYKPGSRFAYSNLGYMVLGSITEILSDRTYDKLIEHYVTGELNMSSTSRHLVDSTRFATPTAGGRKSYEWNFDGIKGVGGLRSTSADMVKYLKMMMGQSDYKFDDAFREATQSRKTLNANLKVAHSWFVNTEFDDEIIYHNGDTGGFSTFVGYSTFSGKGVVILSNSIHSIVDVGLHLINSEHDLVEVKEYLQLETAQLEKLVGIYQSEQLPDFTILREGRQLLGRLGRQQALPLNATSDTEFENKTVQARITFEFKGGQASTLTLHQAGKIFLFERREDI